MSSAADGPDFLKSCRKVICFEQPRPMSDRKHRLVYAKDQVDLPEALITKGGYVFLIRHVWIILFGIFAGVISDARAETAHFAIIGQPKHASSFTHFDYAYADAPKGGTIRQGSRVTFDTTNGMRFPGKMPNELVYIYDSLMVRAEDEPASFYGLLAKNLSVSQDYSKISFELHSAARWHDGTPLTARDVVFTFKTLAKYGLPGYRSILKDVEITSPSVNEVDFESADADWRLFELISTFPIFQYEFWKERDVSQRTLDVPTGSGPYTITKLDYNKQTVLERVPDYWAEGLPVNTGRWNFDQIITDYYSDSNVLVEAMRAGQIDVNREWSPSSWLHGYDGPALREGRIKKSSFVNPRGAYYEALVFNLRHAPLNDRRVRKALSAVFDAAYVREAFYGNLFQAPVGHFAGTILAPTREISEVEQRLLEPFEAELPVGALDDPQPPRFDQMSVRQRTRLADELLDDAGYVVRNGIRINEKTGEELSLTYVGANASDRNVMLYYAHALGLLGITLDVLYFDYAVGRRMILNHEWDITSMGGRTRFPPGSDERFYWHSERAHVPGYALAGAENSALDRSIEVMTSSKNQEEVVSAAKMFSRVLGWERYLLKIAQNDKVWIIHKKSVGFPEVFVPGDFHYLSTLYKEKLGK